MQSSSIIIQGQHQTSDPISKQWREARKYFFSNQTKDVFVGLSEQQHKHISQLFLLTQSYSNQQLRVRFKQFGLQKYSSQIECLQKLYNSIEQQYKRKQRECIQLMKIVQSKYKNLRIIKIQYEQQFDSQGKSNYPYYVSAFKLFEVIHQNKLLVQVTLKGVLIEDFQQFIKLLNLLQSGAAIILQKEVAWMEKFEPSKFLRLSINTEILFMIEFQEQTISQINDLVSFANLLQQLSDVSVIIILGKWTQKESTVNVFQNLWVELKIIKKIRIQVLGDNKLHSFPIHMTPKYRSVLFGGLASLTEIAKLSFLCISFNRNISQNDILAMEQSLMNIFQNNRVTHLKIHYCKKFPIIHKTSTLQSIDLYDMSFRDQDGFIEKIAQTNPLLKSIKCRNYDEEWSIDQSLFNQLQSLIQIWCGISFINIIPNSPSKIKYLRVDDSAIENQDSLALILPKLLYVRFLYFDDVQFEDKLLSTIPSIHLKDLHIQGNSIITGRALTLIDSKWPNLQHLTFRTVQKQHQ